MKYHSSYQDFFDDLENASLEPEEGYGSAMHLTADSIPGSVQFPLELTNQIIAQYCHNPAHPTPMSVMYRALALEFDKALFYRAPPSELFLQGLTHYLDYLHQKHKEAIMPDRYGRYNFVKKNE